ncbi:testis-expressed protein 33 [Salvelinus fontinalis]|uniref:testis-expressed protein 33 n=1 Tax=Salvelinus fontinalis TaxID=8038 RepID=UPI002486209D|nr:testis-expressed protein 33 [Salvelinus fontinalis]XP_055799368.1 testis-expressed protein 33 [Salvelinus fontinalis]
MTSTGQPETTVGDMPQVRILACPEVPPLFLPHYTDTESAFNPPHCSYHSLGHCLRTNIFPGAPLVWKSLVKDSYIVHPLPAPPTDPQRWYGRKTDDMVKWTERNIVNQKLNKALKAMENKGSK